VHTPCKRRVLNSMRPAKKRLIGLTITAVTLLAVIIAVWSYTGTEQFKNSRVVTRGEFEARMEEMKKLIMVHSPPGGTQAGTQKYIESAEHSPPGGTQAGTQKYIASADVEYYPLNPQPLGAPVAPAIPDQDCSDHDERCEEQARSSMCISRADWMEPSCKKACNLCHIRDTRFDDAPAAFAAGKRFTSWVNANLSQSSQWGDAVKMQQMFHANIDSYLEGVCDAKSPLFEGDILPGLCEGRATESLVAGHTAQIEAQTHGYLALAMVKKPRTVCEVGFNAGHSAASMMSGADAQSSYIGFAYDAVREHEEEGLNHRLATRLAQQLGNAQRFAKMRFGKSQVTVPEFFAANGQQMNGGQGCQMVSIDGSHSFRDVLLDMRNFKQGVDREKHLIVVDDTRCTSWYCEPPTRAWVAAIEEGLVRELACWTTTYNLLAPERWSPASDLPRYHPDYRGWCAGEYIFDDLPELSDDEKYRRLIQKFS